MPFLAFQVGLCRPLLRLPASRRAREPVPRRGIQTQHHPAHGGERTRPAAAGPGHQRAVVHPVPRAVLGGEPTAHQAAGDLRLRTHPRHLSHTHTHTQHTLTHLASALAHPVSRAVSVVNLQHIKTAGAQTPYAPMPPHTHTSSLPSRPLAHNPPPPPYTYPAGVAADPRRELEGEPQPCQLRPRAAGGAQSGSRAQVRALSHPRIGLFLTHTHLHLHPLRMQMQVCPATASPRASAALQAHLTRGG